MKTITMKDLNKLFWTPECPNKIIIGDRVYVRFACGWFPATEYPEGYNGVDEPVKVIV